MKITYKEKEYELKYSFRALMIYENITQKSFQPKNLTDIITFFYSIVLSSAQEAIDFNEFIDWLDENVDELNKFSAWLMASLDLNRQKEPKPKKKSKENTGTESKN